MIYKPRYRNFGINEPDVDLAVTNSTADIETEGKAWTFLDNVFGAADSAADIYGKVRQTQVYGPAPYAPPVPQRNPNTIAYVIGGVVVLGIIAILIIKK